jgi:hypothetical protein
VAVPGRAMEDRVLHIAPFRIFEEGDPHEAVVALHGWLTEPVVDELANVVSRKRPGVSIDLSHLVGADQAGLVALRRLRDEAGVSLTGSTPLFELLLGEMQAAARPRGPGARRS